MKKTLAAMAVLGAFSGSAFAADVTLYGVADLGLNYQHQKVGDADATSKFSQNSGQNSASRFGLKGTEDLGNGYKVGFVLENGFNADDGTLGNGGRLFGREANVYLQGDFGTLSMGRVGALSAGAGSYNVVYGYTGFSTGWGDTVGAKGLFNLGDRDRMDNTVTYVTPSFGGLTAYAQYSFNAEGAESDQSSLNKRYAGLGLKYDLGAFSTGLVVDTVMNKSTNTNAEDSLGVSWGASYDFGVAKVLGFAQYGKNENKLGGFVGSDAWITGREADKGGAAIVDHEEGVKGYALALGVAVPAFGGTALAQVNYVDGESEGVIAMRETGNDGHTQFRTAEFNRWGLAAAYEYPLSKRTKVYGFAGYNEGTIDSTGTKVVETTSTKTKTAEVGAGLVHVF